MPRMSEEEYQILKKDIAANGLLVPIEIFDDKVIDGVHRQRACNELGIEPEYVDASIGEMTPGQYVWSLNGARRHLKASQRAAAAVKLLPELEKKAKERQRKVAAASNRRRAGKKPEPEKIPALGADARDEAAAIVGVNPRYVSDAKKVEQEDPEAFEKLLAGEVTLQEIKRKKKDHEREVKRQEAAKQIEAAPTIEVALSSAKFTTICIDPPWDWGDENDVSQFGRGRTTYGEMSFDELLQLPVGEYADADSHIYLWITNRSLPKGFKLLEAWGFRYITCITWCKPSFGMGNYFRGSTEQILFGIRGSLSLKRKDAGTWFAAKRGEGGHSSKPEEFYQLVESCSPGPYLDVFSRQERPGWKCWGGQL